MTHRIDFANIDELLDSHQIFAAMRNGKWWEIRRNGKTQRWVRDPARVRIPFKAGLRLYGAITEKDFSVENALDPDIFRHKEDLPK